MPHDRKVVSLLSGLMILIGVAILSIGVVEPVSADPPPPDYPCRGCHGDSQRQLLLPSDETLPLGVDLSVLDGSAHGSDAGSSLLCTDCHTGRARYRYPHQPNPAQDRHEFVAAVSQNCQGCHYPHNPLHGELGTESATPACADCHGSHDIADASELKVTMPAACLACHTDQSIEWAAGLIPVRSGLGEAAPGYVGSDRCAGCHDQQYYTWRTTLHAKMIQDPVNNPAAIVADFDQDDPERTFGLSDVVYTIGSRRVQRYLSRDEEGDFHILPAQWNVEQEEWIAYNADGWQEHEWRQSCGSCHVTGLNTATWGFSDLGIGCEGCHGPGAAHVADPEQVKPFSAVDDQVCGSCHSRGTSPDGFAFPATYRPGDKLTDHFQFTTDEDHVWPDGSAKRNYQQYMDWQLGSRMALAEDMHCTTCHSVHDAGAGAAQLRISDNELCTQCHSDKRAIVRHIPYHEQALTEYRFACVDCHMPKMAAEAALPDFHNHSFLQPNPQASIDHGGIEKMPNACNLCHTDLGDSPERAVQTIAYAGRVATPEPAAVFGPGPTPTSPPPPTPIPSVGDPVQEVQVETGRWLRITVYVIFGLILAAIVYWVFRAARSRRWSNA